MKIAVSTYSFYPLVDKGIMTFTDMVRRVKEMGFDAIEFTSLNPGEGVSKTDYAHTLRALCGQISLPVANYTVGGDFINGRDGGTPETEIQRLKSEVDIAEILGAPGIRHDVMWHFGSLGRKFRGFENMLPQLAKGCREVTEYAAGKGIRTMSENHGFIVQDSTRMEKLVNTVAHENYGLLVDMGNFLCVDEDPVHAVSRTAAYAFHAHAKDFHVKSGEGPNPGKGFFSSRGGNYLRGAIVGHGCVPVKHCLRILKQAGYDGYVSIEFEGMEDSLTGAAIGLENLRRYIEEI